VKNKIIIGHLRQIIREVLIDHQNDFYHVTQAKRVESILQNGLKPIQQSPHEDWMDYGEARIYLVTRENAINDVLDMIELSKAIITHTREWAIIKVDGSAVGKTTTDPDMGGDNAFVYTTTPIPASACSVMEYVEL
jgi:hypothetical protein